jgi:NADH:ubiquinone reductase (H+-translocating)
MKDVVIIGGGFGGLTAAKSLVSKLPSDYQLTLISDRDFFTFKPLIHEVATNTYSSETARENIPSFLNSPHFNFVQAKAQKIDLKKQLISLKSHKNKIHFDYLITATGSLTNFYNLPGAEENCSKLESLKDASEIRENINSLFETKDKNNPINIIVVGGGPTGTELSAEIADFAHHLSKKNHKQFRLVLIQRDSSLMPRAAERQRRLASKKLRKLGVALLLNKAVIQVSKTYVVLDRKEKINSDIVIWTAGIKPAELQFNPKAKTERGCLVVDQYLRLIGSKTAFAIGDCALAKDKAGGYVPWLAQSAIAQGKLTAKNILADINKKPKQPFIFKNKGFVLPLGKGTAIADIPFLGIHIIFSGFIPWILNRAVYLTSMLSFSHKLKVARIWTVGLFKGR